MKLMVDLCGADPADIENEMVKTKGSHVRHDVPTDAFPDPSGPY
jgi:hypothetical protein